MKPQSMTNREWFVKKIAVNSSTPEKTVNAIVNHQYEALSISMQTNDVLEVCGFGRFLFNRKKAEKKLIQLQRTRGTCVETANNPETTSLRKSNSLRSVTNYDRLIKELKYKLYGNKSEEHI